VLEAAARPTEPAPVDALTERELAVLELLPTSMTYEEMAAALHLSVNTVKTYLKVVYRKLGADRRRIAVARARQLSLLPPC
jgi:LuxR family transcriptional regulator, maltose regulon positive regulatory protein